MIKSSVLQTRLLTTLLSASIGAMSVMAVPAVAQASIASEEAKKPLTPPKPARLPDGKPNWTGFWVPMGGMLERDFGLGGTPEAPPGQPLPPPPRPFGDFPPLKSPYKEQLQAFLAKMMTEGNVPDPVAKCYPPGMPRMMSMVYGMELLQNPGQVAITSEWQAASRRIWLDQKHPPEDELDPSYVGDSIGHWEGDTLVVETVGIREDVPLNYTGLPHSAKLKITERFTQTSPGILTDELTIVDPDVFVQPWITKQLYRYRPDLKIREYVCLENNRNVGDEGQATFQK